MFLAIWHEYLFLPVFNILIYLYNGAALQNMGLAVIYLTLILRVVLLPFSIISIWKQHFYSKLGEEAAKIAEAYKNDPILQKQEIREFLKKHRVNPWSKAIVLGVQALTLILLYQVFLGGIRGQKLDELYHWVMRPDFVNTVFWKFELGERSIIWPLVVAAFLFFEISWEQREKKVVLQNSDIVYRFLFPLFVFVMLYILPMVKSLFILTSLLFSFIVIRGIEALSGALHKKPEIEEEEE